MDRFYFLSHAAIPFHFRQNARDFVVDEIPLYEFSGVGEHLVLHIRKKNMSTWEMIDRIANHLGIKARDIGYAGLKDKNAMTKQYISIMKKYEEKLESFSHDNIKILDKVVHNNKIKTGHLKGNRFFIRFKKVNPIAAKKISGVLQNIKKHGMPNYFGYQRFGEQGDNYKRGKDILDGKVKEKNVKLKRLLINSYQSHLFNLWLSRRIEISTLISNFSANEVSDMLNMPLDTIKKLQKQEHPFKLLRGDLMMHYPYGKVFTSEDEIDIERFNKRDISITGMLAGNRVKHAVDDAHIVEKEYSENLNIDGARRYAWVFPEDLEWEYKEEDAWLELHFTLPKGSYATVLVEEIAKRDIKDDKNLEEA
jgi:tRNA pseudouridine13 synthase